MHTHESEGKQVMFSLNSIEPISGVAALLLLLLLSLLYWFITNDHAKDYCGWLLAWLLLVLLGSLSQPNYLFAFINNK